MNIRPIVLLLALVSAVVIGCSAAPTPVPTPTPMFLPGELTQLIERDLAEVPFSFSRMLEKLTGKKTTIGSTLGTCLDVTRSHYRIEEAQINDRIWSVSAIPLDATEIGMGAVWHINAYTPWP